MTENQTCFDHGRSRRSWVKITNIWQLSSSRIKGRREGKARVVGTKKSTVSNPLSIFPPWTIFSTKLRDNWGEVKIHCVMFFYWKKKSQKCSKREWKNKTEIELICKKLTIFKSLLYEMGHEGIDLRIFCEGEAQKNHQIRRKLIKIACPMSLDLSS